MWPSDRAWRRDCRCPAALAVEPSKSRTLGTQGPSHRGLRHIAQGRGDQSRGGRGARFLELGGRKWSVRSDRILLELDKYLPGIQQLLPKFTGYQCCPCPSLGLESSGTGRVCVPRAEAGGHSPRNRALPPLPRAGSWREAGVKCRDCGIVSVPGGRRPGLIKVTIS